MFRAQLHLFQREGCLPGDYEFPFGFKLPDTLPQSLMTRLALSQAAKAKVSYKIKAKIIRSVSADTIGYYRDEQPYQPPYPIKNKCFMVIRQRTEHQKSLTGYTSQE